MLFAACWTAVALRLGTYEDLLNQFWMVFALAPLCTIPVLIPMGLYRAVIRYVGYRSMWTVVRAVSLGVLVWALVVTLFDLFVPRSSIVIYWMAALVAVGGTRLLGRWMFRQLTPIGRSYKNQHASRALIFGAGASGQQMATAFLMSPEVSPIGFLDDDQTIHGSEIQGLRVYGLNDLERLIRQYDIDTVLLGVKNMPIKRKREVVHFIEQYPITVKAMPILSDAAQGKLQFSNMPNIDVTDLLGRDSVAPDLSLLASCVQGKAVMVTGAGGSIGSELCRQIIALKPIRLVLFELTEFALYSIESELAAYLQEHEVDVELIPIIGSVQDKQHLERVMTCYGINTVYHAAAYKHVPLVEHNVISGVRNNLFGTLYAAEASVCSGVDNFVLISTDKAVRPTNIMGATKRMAEMALQAISDRESKEGSSIKFAMVRFGNVLGSSGSVIPLFRKQISLGGPVTVTHPEITRYFMTIPEAASLVIQAGAMGEGGDVFLLDMGQPIRINELAKDMILLAGYSVRDEHNPSGDIEIVYSGLRPGEKLYEELLIQGDVQGTDHKMIMKSSEDFIGWDKFREELVKLEHLMSQCDYLAIREMFMNLVSGYEPESGIKDYLYQSRSDVVMDFQRLDS
ncbi:MAG: polysaccharide biosynthesis protein [Bacteroidetes bacterium]|nr:MAG: polysaccharide biosynthesis protein [Bacteroidota bacterium]